MIHRTMPIMTMYKDVLLSYIYAWKDYAPLTPCYTSARPQSVPWKWPSNNMTCSLAKRPKRPVAVKYPARYPSTMYLLSDAYYKDTAYTVRGQA